MQAANKKTGACYSAPSYQKRRVKTKSLLPLNAFAGLTSNSDARIEVA
jgi:hypothetical protein